MPQGRAIRTGTEVTPDTGNQVIAYLATTRRWRVAGLLVALLIGLTWLVLAGAGGVSSLQLLAGWFIGATIAEARLARKPAGARRSASLQLRAPAAYLSRAGRAALPVALAASLGLAAATAVIVASDPDSGPAGPAVPAGLAVSAVLLVTGVVWVVGRRVLRRPQPVLPADQLAADDAIRSRSLHAHSGAGTALVPVRHDLPARGARHRLAGRPDRAGGGRAAAVLRSASGRLVGGDHRMVGAPA